MSKKVTFNQEAREKLRKGVNILADAVGSTLSPKGQNVAIETEYGYPKVIHDGVGVAKEIYLEDPIENMGAQLVKGAAQRTNEVAGDGTTTSTILAQSMINQGLDFIEMDTNSSDMKRGMDHAVSLVVAELDRVAIPVKADDKKTVESVAIISAQNEEIGKAVAQAVNAVGKDGVVTVEESTVLGIEVDVREGMQLDKGYASAFFVTDVDSMEAEMKDVSILLADFPISDKNQLMVLMKKLTEAGKRDLVIICDKVEGDALSVLVVNKKKQIFNSLVVKCPGFGDWRKKWLADIAAVTGGTVISEEQGRTIDKVDLSELGTIRSIKSTYRNTTIVGTATKKDVEKRIKIVRKELEGATEQWEKDRIAERLARLTGGVAVISIGGATQVEMMERKERVIDAVGATQAALDEGIVPGGEVTLFKSAMQVLKNSILPVKGDKDYDFNMGIELIFNACHAPFRKLMSNCGVDKDRVDACIASILQDNFPNAGIDVMDGEVKDMVKAKIIDPKKVLKHALLNAASVASILMTTATTITRIPEKE